MKKEISTLKLLTQNWDSVEGIIARTLVEIAIQLERLNNNYLKSQEKIDLPR